MRRRMLSPEFFTDADIVANFDAFGRLFYQGLWCVAEDSGCFEINQLSLKMKIFPGDNISLEQLQQYIDKLIELDKVVPYEANGRQYGWLKNFHKHQRLDKPSPPSIPLPDFILWHGEEEFGDKRHKYYYEVLPIGHSNANENPCLRQVYDKSCPEEKRKEEKRKEVEGKGIDSSSQNAPMSPEPQPTGLDEEKQQQEQPDIKFDESSVQYKLAFYLRGKILANLPSARVPEPDPKSLEKWSLEFDRMIRLDARAPTDIRDMIDFSQYDSFWRANILSPRKLREKWETLVLQSQRWKQTGAQEPTRQKPKGFAAIERLAAKGGDYP